MVLNGVSIAKELKKIYLGDNQFNEEQDVLDCIKNCMTKNKTLAKYDFRNNSLEDAGKLHFTFESIQPLNFSSTCLALRKRVRFLMSLKLKSQRDPPESVRWEALIYPKRSRRRSHSLKFSRTL
jgi:hypothetical protein